MVIFESGRREREREERHLWNFEAAYARAHIPSPLRCSPPSSQHGMADGTEISLLRPFSEQEGRGPVNLRQNGCGVVVDSDLELDWGRFYSKTYKRHQSSNPFPLPQVEIASRREQDALRFVCRGGPRASAAVCRRCQLWGIECIPERSPSAPPPPPPPPLMLLLHYLLRLYGPEFRGQRRERAGTDADADVEANLPGRERGVDVKDPVDVSRALLGARGDTFFVRLFDL